MTDVHEADVRLNRIINRRRAGGQDAPTLEDAKKVEQDIFQAVGHLNTLLQTAALLGMKTRVETVTDYGRGFESIHVDVTVNPRVLG